MDSNTSGNCARCGNPLPPDAPNGLCPLCLLKQGFLTGHPSTFVPPSPADLAGHFPGLEILEMIGRGGMGVVYKARQRDLDRIVALKILPSAPHGDPTFAERFTREARALARLSHPNIVSIHDFGEKDGLFFFLMEYVDGVNLRQAMQGGRLAPEQALAIVPQICDALQYAHDQGIVHRDIKPENVLMEKSGRIKIADFGLAKILSPNATDAGLTQAGQFMGTTYYMAPEQVERPQDVDRRADIYSLGVVFYQMLTGELPLGRFSPPSQSIKVDVRLDEVVLRALENKPELRFSQASEVKTEIETIQATPGKARKPIAVAKGTKDHLVLRLFILLLAPIACFVAARTFKALYPRDYQTTATLKISQTTLGDPGFSILFESLEKLAFMPAILSPLLADEAFRDKTPDAALSSLRKAVRIRKSDWEERALEITVQWPNPAGSDRLARAFANSLASTVSRNYSANAESALYQLEQQIAAQRSKVEALGEELKKMPMGQASATEDLQAVASEKQGIQSALESALGALQKSRNELEAIPNLTAPGVLQRAGFAQEFAGGQFADLSLKYRVAESKRLDLLTSGLGENNPSAKAQSDIMKTALEQCGNALTAMPKDLEGQMDAAKLRIKGLEETRSYLTAKIRFLEERKILTAVEQKLKKSREEANVPAMILKVVSGPERMSASGLLVTLPIFATALGLVTGLGLAAQGRHTVFGISAAAVLLVVSLGANAMQVSFTVPSPPPKPARISIGGEVKKPQLMDYEPDLTVSRAIIASGGFTDYADQKKIRLIRDGKVTVIDGKALRQNPSLDVPLIAGDTIEVPQSVW